MKFAYDIASVPSAGNRYLAKCEPRVPPEEIPNCRQPRAGVSGRDVRQLPDHASTSAHGTFRSETDASLRLLGTLCSRIVLAIHDLVQ
jgi:hypothetical protein